MPASGGIRDPAHNKVLQLVIDMQINQLFQTSKIILLMLPMAQT